MSSTHTFAYSRSHTAAFASDKMRNLLKVLVRYHGLNPEKLVDAWSDWADRAVRTWLESEHLTTIVIEFYWPGSSCAAARWDFPIRYDGSGIDDDMWVDKQFFEDSFDKAAAPPTNCNYRVLLCHSSGAPHVPGLSTTKFLSTAGLLAREAGTVIATPDIMASATYYRAA